MDIVLGVSMAPKTIRMVLVEGEDADGVTVEEDNIDTAHSAPDQVIAAILGTREGATEGGYQLRSTGVTWTDPVDAAALRDALAARKIENVMLVSAFLAAAALTQTVGQAMGYEHTAMLFVEPETATLAVVDASDGSVTDVRRRPLRSDDVAGELAAMAADLDGLETRPEGLFLVGCGIDVAPIKPALEATTWLPVSAPEDPASALARGAALASANAPLFASSTAALAYAQDPGTGVVDPYYFETLSDGGSDDVAYSAVADDDADADTTVLPVDQARQRRRPLLLVGSMLAVVFVTAALALEIALALGIRPTVALLPAPVQRLIEPTESAPAPPPAASVSEPQPPAAHMAAPAPQPAQVHAVAPPEPLAVPAPPVLAAPAPVPPPAAPAPAPVPVPVPIRIPVPAPVQAPLPQLPINLPVPQPPAQHPTPPVHVPTPPVRQPSPPVHVPTPPVQQPTPPIHLPTPPVQDPTPPVHLPTPPVQDPTPPWKLPSSPIHAPTPPVQDPTPPIHLPTPIQMPEPQPPVNMPAPKPPLHLSIPQLPQMPAPAAPQAPAMPSPALPQMPSMPHFSIPSFKF